MKTRAAVFGLIAFAVLSRFLPLPPNFTSIGALALFGGAYFSSPIVAMLVVFSCMFVSDVFIGFHSTLPYVYVALVLTIFLGRATLGDATARGNVTTTQFVGSTLAHSVLFFVVTNFGVWATQTLYPQTFAGLVTCFIAGLPFFGYTLAGALFFGGVFFGTLSLLNRETTPANVRGTPALRAHR